MKIERKAEFQERVLPRRDVRHVGGAAAHNLISWNAGASLHRQLRGRPCETYLGDMRVLVPSAGLYTYPDVVIVCSEPKFPGHTFRYPGQPHRHY